MNLAQAKELAAHRAKHEKIDFVVFIPSADKLDPSFALDAFGVASANDKLMQKEGIEIVLQYPAEI